MKLISAGLLAALLLFLSGEFGACQNGITVTPPTNQTIAFGNNMNITYECTVDNGRIAEFVFREIPITPGGELIDLLADAGIFIEQGPDQSTERIIVTQMAREVGPLAGPDIELQCSAITQDLLIQFGDLFYVRTFVTPTVPQNFDLNPSPGNLSRLVLTWDAPNNTVFDSGDPVVTTYTVMISGPVVNLVENTTDTRFEFVDSLDQPCAMHTFQVMATNDAGTGPAAMINETIPVSPDITLLNSSLTVSNIDLSGTGVRVSVTFAAATTCSNTFPLLRYMVSVVNGPSVTFPVVEGEDPITLLAPMAGLVQDEDYYIFVEACISVTCRSSNPVRVRTTDVQSASITFFENNVFLECSFADRISGRGCAFRLTTASGDPEMITVPADPGRQCDVTLNMRNAYNSIEVVDWESDNRFGMVTTMVSVNPVIQDVANYTAMTGCVPPRTGLSAGAIAGIVIGVLVAVVIILVIAILIAMLIYWQRTKKLPHIKRHEDDKLSVDFEKNWLMDDTIGLKKSGSLRKGKVSFRRGASAVDGTEEASIAYSPAGGPPPPPTSASGAATMPSPTRDDKPSLTQPQAAFTLHIDRDQKRARLHLNRALIRQVLKEKRMTTLERKQARSRTTNNSLRQLLLPLHSEIHVTGDESSEEEHRDGGESEDQLITPI